MVKELNVRYKFRLDIDGFAWTTRWRAELSANSVVLKATLYVSLHASPLTQHPRRQSGSKRDVVASGSVGAQADKVA